MELEIGICLARLESILMVFHWSLCASCVRSIRFEISWDLQSKQLVVNVVINFCFPSTKIMYENLWSDSLFKCASFSLTKIWKFTRQTSCHHYKHLGYNFLIMSMGVQAPISTLTLPDSPQEHIKNSQKFPVY